MFTLPFDFTAPIIEGGHKFTSSSNFSICGECGYEWPMGVDSKDLPTCAGSFDPDLATGPRAPLKCTCGSAAIGIKPYAVGHSDFCDLKAF